MIEDPPLLQIRRNFARPERALLDRLAGVPTEHLVDAMDGRGALDFMVKPVDPARASFVGSAVTCLCAPGDNLAIVAALAQLQPNDVIVAATDAHTSLAVVGRRITEGIGETCVGRVVFHAACDFEASTCEDVGQRISAPDRQ